MRILAGYVHKKENIVQYPTKKTAPDFSGAVRNHLTSC